MFHLNVGYYGSWVVVRGGVKGGARVICGGMGKMGRGRVLERMLHFELEGGLQCVGL